MNLDWQRLHINLVDHLVQIGSIRSASVERAFRKIPRHLFLPGVDISEAYSNKAILTKKERETCSSSTQPSLMATMLEQMEVKAGDRVLEIGAGTGYNAAILAELVGPSGSVVTIDINEDTCQKALCHLQTAGCRCVKVACDDGAFGFAQEAPYDHIELTAMAYDISPHWVEQLVEGGTLTVCLLFRGHQIIPSFIKSKKILRSRSVCYGGFMPLRGVQGAPQTYRRVTREWACAGDNISEGSLEVLRELLQIGPAIAPLRGIDPFLTGTRLATKDPRALALIATDRDVSGTALFAPSKRCLSGLMAVRRSERWEAEMWTFGTKHLVEPLSRRLSEFAGEGDTGPGPLCVEAHPHGRVPTSPSLVPRDHYDLLFT